MNHSENNSFFKPLRKTNPTFQSKIRNIRRGYKILAFGRGLKKCFFIFAFLDWFITNYYYHYHYSFALSIQYFTLVLHKKWKIHHPKSRMCIMGTVEIVFFILQGVKNKKMRTLYWFASSFFIHTSSFFIHTSAFLY